MVRQSITKVIDRIIGSDYETITNDVLIVASLPKLHYVSTELSLAFYQCHTTVIHTRRLDSVAINMNHGFKMDFLNYMVSPIQFLSIQNKFIHSTFVVTTLPAKYKLLT